MDQQLEYFILRLRILKSSEALICILSSKSVELKGISLGIVGGVSSPMQSTLLWRWWSVGITTVSSVRGTFQLTTYWNDSWLGKHCEVGTVYHWWAFFLSVLTTMRPWIWASSPRTTMPFSPSLSQLFSPAYGTHIHSGTCAVDICN